MSTINPPIEPKNTEQQRTFKESSTWKKMVNQGLLSIAKGPVDLMLPLGMAECISAIKEGADLCAKDEMGNTALHLACENNNSYLIEYLASNKAVFEVLNNEGNAPIHMAIVGLSEAEKEKQNDLNEATKKLRALSPEMLKGIAQKNNSNPVRLFLVEQLVLAGADLNQKNAQGSTPLHLAIQKNDETMVKLLTRLHADLDVKDRKVDKDKDKSKPKEEESLESKIKRWGFELALKYQAKLILDEENRRIEAFFIEMERVKRAHFGLNTNPTEAVVNGKEKLESLDDTIIPNIKEEESTSSKPVATDNAVPSSPNSLLTAYEQFKAPVLPITSQRKDTSDQPKLMAEF